MLLMIEQGLGNRGWSRNTFQPDYFVSIEYSIGDRISQPASKLTTKRKHIPATNATVYTSTHQSYTKIS